MRDSLLLLLLCFGITGTVNASLPPASLSQRTPLWRRGAKPPTPSAPINSNATVHTVTVGQAQHSFRPTSLNATVGDFITFLFYPSGHSATLGDFDVPCSPWGYTHPTEQDFWSGLVTTDSKANVPGWTYQVKSDNPQFFYCNAPGSCQTYGMVFALNPNSVQTFQAYYDGAKNARYAISPGENPPPEGPVPTTTPPNNKLSGGAIAGIVIGSLALIIIIVMLSSLIVRKRRDSGNTNPPAPTPAPPHTSAPPPTSPMVASYYGDPVHSPPGYDGRAFSPAPSHFVPLSPPMAHTWNDAYKPPSSPGFPSPPVFHVNPHDSIYSAGTSSPRPGYQSWAPSELPGHHLQD